MKFAIAGILMQFIISSNSRAQSYEVKSFDELEQFLASNMDTLYVINFWATWCRPCIAELPNFEQLHRENKSVKVILVSLDGENQWEKSLQPFLMKNNIAADVWVLPDKKPVDWIDRIDKSWQGSIPGTLFINNAKGIKVFEEHEFTYEELIEKIRLLQQMNN